MQALFILREELTARPAHRHIYAEALLRELDRRLIDASAYDIGTYEFFKGFICGMHAGNYDITHFYIDNFFKLVEDKSEESFAAFIAWLDKFSAQENIEFVLSCSADPEKAPESVKPLLI